MRFESLEQDPGCLAIVSVEFHQLATIFLQTFHPVLDRGNPILDGRYKFAENRGVVVPKEHHWYCGRMERQLHG
jgi:hypothetical protein